MSIPLDFVSRLAIPLVVAALYWNGPGEVDLGEQAQIFENTMRLADQVLFEAENKVNSSSPTFDYIIIGAGTAGSLLANSLSEANNVLLLEAGGDQNPILDIPYAHADVFWKTRVMDWNYTTVKQNRSCLYNFNGSCWWPRGKALGGTTAINVGVYNRCLRKDYDSWANFTGDSSWSWENLRETLNDIEDYHGAYEGESNEKKGIPIGDLDGGEIQYGFSTVDYNIKDGQRWGSYKSHLEPALNRSNLVVERYATAQKILFNGTQAIGVVFERHGKVLQAFANKEVIVSAGAVESPKLLLLSGIGPKEHLDSLNISTLVDLPVGKYLQEHPGMDILGKDNMGFVLNTTFGMNLKEPELVQQFVENGTGPFNSYSRNPRLMKGYLNSSFNSDKDWPENYIFVYEKFSERGNGEPPQEEVYFTVELMRTRTTGSVKLASSDPNEKPLIDPNFFEDPTDIDRMIDAIEVMMDVFLNSSAYRQHGIKLFEPFELCSVEEGHQFLSRDYWRCYIHQFGDPHFHTTSTCRMGPSPDVAVVDSSLRVFGIKNLRVVDSSVIPFAPTGNPNMPTVAVAQRAAALILLDSTS
ncbi:Oxygen-dependent choline dehydrogenase [Orchesella cincta]|uniref:Oxygen-dependent choline dehydrogenase n=1 Tax=Orchesella cincta TaxID=48709 RepID=A0A1D2MQ64_ORCCI|nr:Oxygen-dependent choline dehydrogenase [Orchesella cincta]